MVDDPVVQIDRQGKTVITADGAVIPYSKLVIATGIWTNRTLQKMSLPLLPLVTSIEQQTYYSTPPGKTARITGFFGSDCCASASCPISPRHGRSLQLQPLARNHRAQSTSTAADETPWRLHDPSPEQRRPRAATSKTVAATWSGSISVVESCGVPQCISRQGRRREVWDASARTFARQRGPKHP